MKVEIAITGPDHAIQTLYQKLKIFSPTIQAYHGQLEGKDENPKIILIENEESLDNTLLKVSRIVNKLERNLSIDSRLEFRIRNLAYSEPTPESHIFREPFRPIPAITIQPWYPSLSPIRDDRTIIIDPHHAFGIGTHPTSRMCLNFIDLLAQRVSPEWRQHGWEVLDFGCGTGLLAIAAVKMGAKSALGVEIDRQSALTATRNVQLNGLSEKVEIREGSWEVVKNNYDLILANLVASALFRMGTHIPLHLKDQGKVVISGFGHKQLERMEQLFRRLGLATTDRSNLEGWSALVMVKRHLESL